MKDSELRRPARGYPDSELPPLYDLTVLIKGAGEMATGIAHRLYMARIRRIAMTEITAPLTVRRTVAFSEAVHEGSASVEGVVAELVDGEAGILAAWEAGKIAVIVDPECTIAHTLKPHVVIDAIMAKRNTGTTHEEAPLVIGVGPGFTAPGAVHVVIESNRGHSLGRAIYEGSAEPHTGVPGDIGGYTSERVMRAPHGGIVRHLRAIGDTVREGEPILYVGETVVTAPISGVLRGLIREIPVTAKEKVGDVDPRAVREHCFLITEKARAIAGGVLETLMHYWNRENHG